MAEYSLTLSVKRDGEQIVEWGVVDTTGDKAPDVFCNAMNAFLWAYKSNDNHGRNFHVTEGPTDAEITKVLESA